MNHHPHRNAPTRDDYQQVAELLAALEVYLPNCDSARATSLLLPLTLALITHALLAGHSLDYQRTNQITATLAIAARSIPTPTSMPCCQPQTGFTRFSKPVRPAPVCSSKREPFAIPSRLFAPQKETEVQRHGKYGTTRRNADHPASRLGVIRDAPSRPPTGEIKKRPAMNRAPQLSNSTSESDHEHHCDHFTI